MTGKPLPQLGWLVHYVLGRDDVRAVTTRRAYTGATGAEPFKGQICPAFVVAHVAPEQDGGETLLNLQVLLDGEDRHWAVRIEQGTAQETWRWPAPVAANVIVPAPHPMDTAAWIRTAPPHDPAVMKAAADVYYAAHPELDPAQPRSLEFVTRYPAGWSDDGIPGVEVIGHMDLAENPGYGVPSKDTHVKEVERE
jgi:hypothetical protein